MSQVELLTVEDTFDLSGLGLTIVPVFEIPSSWRNTEEDVTVVLPDSTSLTARAKFERTHFRLVDTSRLSNPWQIVIRMPAETKLSIPIGSRLLVSETLRDALLP